MEEKAQPKDAIGGESNLNASARHGRYRWISELAMFLLIWGLCILCIFSLREKQRELPDWVKRLAMGQIEGKDVSVVAASDIYSDVSFSFVLRDSTGEAVPFDRIIDKEQQLNNVQPLADASLVQKIGDERLKLDIAKKQASLPKPAVEAPQDGYAIDMVNAASGEEKYGAFLAQVDSDDCLVKAGDLLIQVSLQIGNDNVPKVVRHYTPAYYRLMAYMAQRQYADSFHFGTLIWLCYAGLLCALMIFGFKYSIDFLRNDVSEFPAKSLRLCSVCQAMHILVIWCCGWLFKQFNSGPSFELFALLPVALGASLCANLLGRRIGMCTAVMLSMLTPVLVGGTWQYQLFVQGVVTSLIGVLVFRKVQYRKQFLWGGFFILLSLLVLTVFFCLQRDMELLHKMDFWLHIFLLSLLNTTIVIFGMLVFPPIFERLFNVTTVFTLNELNNREHPLLKRLNEQAPGTYEHSMMVARLAADGAKAAGLDEKLAETCAYFHDIGKLCEPKKFAENQVYDDLNPHDSLTPEESCSWLREHVRFGEQMAREAHLPGPVREAIVQHHGTGAMMGFYAKACKNAEIDGQPVPDIRKYSYTTGQLPVRAEVVIVSIADACEAAVRSAVKNAAEATPQLIHDTVYSIIRGKYLGNQFDAANLTLDKLRLAVDKMVDTLCVIHHTRPTYDKVPEKAEGKGEETENAGSVK